ncbi:hypothetical protein V8C42DRAFT_132438 [Trichoderma barbatum]
MVRLRRHRHPALCVLPLSAIGGVVECCGFWERECRDRLPKSEPEAAFCLGACSGDGRLWSSVRESLCLAAKDLEDYLQGSGLVR